MSGAGKSLTDNFGKRFLPTEFNKNSFTEVSHKIACNAASRTAKSAEAEGLGDITDLLPGTILNRLVVNTLLSVIFCCKLLAPVRR